MNEEIEHFRASKDEAIKELNAAVREITRNDDMMALVITLTPEEDGVLDFNVMCLNIDPTSAVRALFQAVATITKNHSPEDPTMQ